MKTLTRYAGILIFAAVALAIPARAGDNKGMLQAQVKVALNEMVQDVKAAEGPDAKREILGAFLGKIERRAEFIGKVPFLPSEDRAALNTLQAKFNGYETALHGQASAGVAGVADKDLDAFASFVQQDLEQAEVSWGNGGIYLSTGAVIIILLIIILITR